MSRRSRGCQPCRARKVKCDEGRPCCKICIHRDEICYGYRDEATLIFKDENERTAQKVVARRSSASSLSSGRSASDTSSATSRTIQHNLLDLSRAEASSLPKPYRWTKSVLQKSQPSVEDQAVSQFFEQFVMYPCNDGSSPGFLECLPCLFEEVQTEGRIALRWAVRAASYASLLNEQNRASLAVKAQHCYGRALSALGKTLKDRGVAVSDCTLMTIVVLDLFETLYVDESSLRGSHTVGMAQILRLRGPDQIYSPRGWSLFRLAHHRLQRQQLAFRQSTMPESELWMQSLSDDLPEVRIEQNGFEMNKVCEEARKLRERVGSADLAFDETLDLVSRIHTLDRKVASWRVGPAWEYKIIERMQLPEAAVDITTCPEFIQLHRDVWIAYEWNYHRTARLIMHEQLIECIDKVLDSPSAQNDVLRAGMMSCRAISADIVVSLINDILSTVPQSLGDIDQEGNRLANTTRPKAIGGYFLLWPIKIVKSTKSAEAQQRSMAGAVFERIRECTGMKYALGDASKV